MDAFFASVEMRDHPELRDKPLIIGSMPNERGVVSTCNYAARKFGVHSAQNIKEAYALCPQGVFMHPDMPKYYGVSKQLHEIWSSYADVIEYIASDEAYLDVTEASKRYGSARIIGHLIKDRVLQETGLTCSVGVGYSKTSAKRGSEEKKPDGFYEIRTPEDFVKLVIDRDIQILPGVGEKTAEKLRSFGICKVRDIQEQHVMVERMFGKMGKYITDMAFGIDDRPVVHYEAEDAKSLGREITFQRDTRDFEFLDSVLVLIARNLDGKLKALKVSGATVTLKITYGNMKSITRSRTGEPTNDAWEIYSAAAEQLDHIDREPVRLIGISVSGLSQEYVRQLSLMDMVAPDRNAELFDEKLQYVAAKYKLDLAEENVDGSHRSLYAMINKMESF